MTPAARAAAAIEVLDAVQAGQPAEQVLTTWGRKNRFAGSGDRAAIRDIVFEVLRCLRSCAWLGGGETGRALILGWCRMTGAPEDDVFSGVGHAPAGLSAEEAAAGGDMAEAPRGVEMDIPDWQIPLFDKPLGGDADAVAGLLRSRAPVFLRANLAKADRDGVSDALVRDGVELAPHGLSPTALEVMGRTRGLQALASFRDGLFELQDAASQAIVDRLGDVGGQTVLDYCAGGGGKALALAARGARVTAYDADPGRMRDIPVRAKRAGVSIAVARAPGGTFDLVLCDAPCSGSGAWRRQPEGKWRLTPERLRGLTDIQDGILDAARARVAPGGRLAFATCSVFLDENEDRADAFLARHPDWREIDRLRLSPLDGGDGFFLAVFARA